MMEFDELGDYIEPVTASECFNKALEFFERGKFDNALHYIDEAIEKSYFGTDVYLVRAQILLELERAEEADEDIAIAIAQEPNNTELIIWQARIKTALSDTVEAVRILNDLLEDEPDNSEALLSKAMIHYMESDFEKAETTLYEIYDNSSGFPEQSAVAAYWLAKIKQMQDNNEEALDLYSTSLDLAPFFNYVYSDYADLLRQVGRTEESEEIYQQGLNLFPDNAALANDYANLLRELNRDEESIEYLQLAIKHDPTLIQAFFNLGLTHLKMDRFEDAVECFEKVVEDNPEDTEAKVRLAESYAELHNLSKAYELMYQVCESEPNNTEFLVVFSDIANEFLIELEKSAKWSKAIEVYIAMFVLSIDIFKPSFNDRKNSDAVDRLLKTFRYLEVYKGNDEIEVVLLQSQINIIRFSLALTIFDFINENSGLKSYQIDLFDEFVQYVDSNIGVIREISKKLDNESDPLAYYGFYLQAMYYWRVKNQKSEAETNIFRAINHCENNLAAILNVKAQFYKSIFDFRESILSYLKTYRQDKNAIWVHREISKLYAGLRNFEAAIYYHQKYMKLLSNFSESNREVATAALDSAALWLAYGNLTRCKQDIEKCKKIPAKLDAVNKIRLKLLEIYVALEAKDKPETIKNLFKEAAKFKSEITKSFNLRTQFEALYTRFYKQKPEFKDAQKNEENHYNLIAHLPDFEEYQQTGNKRIFNAVFNKICAKLKVQDHNVLSEYYQMMTANCDDCTVIEFIVNLLAPIYQISEDAWVNTHDLVQFPEEFAYLRRIAHLKLISTIKKATGKKELEKTYRSLLVLSELFPTDRMTSILLNFVTMINGDSYDYLLSGLMSKQQSKLQRIRDLFMLTKLGDTEDLVFLEELETARANYELARIRALQSYNEDALIHLENFVDESRDKNLAKAYVKSDFAFDILRTETARFYQQFADDDISIIDDDDENDDFDIDAEDDSNDTSVVLDLLNELNKDLESLQNEFETNFNDLSPEDSQISANRFNNLEEPKPIHKKNSAKKIDSSQDNSSDNDESA